MVYLMLPTDCFAGAASVVAKTCGGWNQHRKNGDPSSMADEAWLIGYLTGISTSADVDFIRVIDLDSIKGWMDSYCQAHPLKYLEDGGQELAIEMVEKKHPHQR